MTMENLDSLNSLLTHRKNNNKMNSVQSTYRRTSFVSAGVITAPLQSINTFSTISTTNSFNIQCREFTENLRELSQRYNAKVRQAVALDSTYKSSRSQVFRWPGNMKRLMLRWVGMELEIGMKIKNKRF